MVVYYNIYNTYILVKAVTKTKSFSTFYYYSTFSYSYLDMMTIKQFEIRFFFIGRSYLNIYFV